MNQFEMGVRYPEKAINERLKRCKPDHATLRRDLIDYGFMQRGKGVYWRVEPTDSS